MVKVSVSNNVERKSDIVEASVTVREVLEKFNINYSGVNITVNTHTIAPAQLDKSLAEFGSYDTYFISAIERKDNACTDAELEALIHDDDWFNIWINM